jgi:small subunit ribosomal protein S5
VNGEWNPRTRLGKLIRSGEITTMKEALETGLPLREPEIVDLLLPDLEDEVLDVNMVQRMTDSGRRVKFAITVVVGNRDGYVGVGQFKGKEVGPSIRKAINNAKLNIIPIKRGCGSWECGCGTHHTIPFQVRGKSSSVEVVLKPAPRGVGLAVGNVAKSILSLAGFEDVWGFTRGQTRTTVNYAKAVFAALEQLAAVRVREGQEKLLGIMEGKVEV